MVLSRVLGKGRPIRPVLPNVLPLMQNRLVSTLIDEVPYWQKIPRWKDVTAEQFISYRWQSHYTINDKYRLSRFLLETLPDELGASTNEQLKNIRTKEDFIEDAVAALKLAPMAIRLSPHILSRVDWNNPLDDPVRKQFLPLRSGIVPDHEKLTLDSLHEQADSPVPGLVHRYPGRALFLATSICPVYCRFCTRSYAVGPKTETNDKKPQRPSRARWEVIFRHIEKTPSLQDIVVSGGDSFFLSPRDLIIIGERLLAIPHIRRIRFASKGLAVAPSRFLDETDPWTDTLIALSKQGRKMGKQVCLHTHINHANEITWVTRKASNKLFEHGVIVRNQSVLLKGVNNSRKALSDLITSLADINIQPYYIYQCDMVSGIEDLRTPLAEIIDLDVELRGTLSGFMMPAFVVDLPGGGGKRLVSTYKKHDAATGVYVYTAPGLEGEKGEKEYFYHDPKPVQASALEELRQRQNLALEQGVSLQELNRSPLRTPPRPQTSMPDTWVPQADPFPEATQSACSSR